MEAHELEEHVERRLDALYREFADVVPETEIGRLSEANLSALRSTATIYDYIPLLVYRFTREQLLRSAPDELHRSA